MCLNIRSDMLKIRLGPIWAKAHMGQGPYGPRALPCRANTSPKNAPWKKESKLCFFVYFLETKKMRDVHAIILAALSRRDLCYVSENKGFRFVKNNLINADPTFIARRSRAHFCFMKFLPINVLVPYVCNRPTSRLLLYLRS